MRNRAVAQLKKPDIDEKIDGVADEELIERTRRGDRRAFAELWRRHYRSGITVARSFTTLDADDLVSESFARIYKRTLEGGGPRGAFRPYLYTTIRNLASTWGTARAKHINVDEFDEFEPTESAEEPVARSLDRTLTVQAYRSLPARWQTVLWYTEVEGLDPSDVAPILGISANSVAALSYRAREGLRKAWLQAHVSDATASGTCAWVIERVGEHARHSLTERENAKLQSHLAVCPKCSIVAEEVDDVGSRLAMVMLPLLLGGVAGGTLLAASATGGSAAVAASASGIAIPALPASIGAAAASASTATIATIAASTIVIAGAGAGAVGLVNANSHPAPAAAASTSQPGALADPLGIGTGKPTSDPTALAPVTDATDPTSTTVPVAPTTIAPPTDTTSTTTPTTTDQTTSSTDKSTPDTTSKDATTTDSTTKTTTDSAGKSVTKVVTTTTDTVDKVTKTATSTVGTVVGATTDTVDSVVDTVLPPGTGVTGTLNSTVDTVTGTVDSTVGVVTGTVDSTVTDVTGLVGGLVGGLIGH